jgi:hypothetical protein
VSTKLTANTHRWSKAAAKDYRDAIQWTAYCYEHGRGTEQNHERSLQLYSRAALMGDPESAYRAADMSSRYRTPLQPPSPSVAATNTTDEKKENASSVLVPIIRANPRRWLRWMTLADKLGHSSSATQLRCTHAHTNATPCNVPSLVLQNPSPATYGISEMPTKWKWDDLCSEHMKLITSSSHHNERSLVSSITNAEGSAPILFLDPQQTHQPLSSDLQSKAHLFHPLLVL